jgi:hypothetical protein
MPAARRQCSPRRPRRSPAIGSSRRARGAARPPRPSTRGPGRGTWRLRRARWSRLACLLRAAAREECRAPAVVQVAFVRLLPPTSACPARLHCWSALCCARIMQACLTFGGEGAMLQRPVRATAVRSLRHSCSRPCNCCRLYLALPGPAPTHAPARRQATTNLIASHRGPPTAPLTNSNAPTATAARLEYNTWNRLSCWPPP